MKSSTVPRRRPVKPSSRIRRPFWPRRRSRASDAVRPWRGACRRNRMSRNSRRVMPSGPTRSPSRRPTSTPLPASIRAMCGRKCRPRSTTVGYRRRGIFPAWPRTRFCPRPRRHRHHRHIRANCRAHTTPIHFFEEKFF